MKREREKDRSLREEDRHDRITVTVCPPRTINRKTELINIINLMRTDSEKSVHAHTHIEYP